MHRYVPYALIIVAAVLALIAAAVWSWQWLWLLVLLVPLIAVGTWDMHQTQHALRRLYPVSAHVRWFFEWQAAQTFIRWARLGVWERLWSLAREGDVKLNMAFLDGSGIRAHQKAAGAARKGGLRRSEISVRRLAALVAAMGPRPA